MEKMMMAGYTIGVDAYGDVKNICPLYGNKIAVIGGNRALKAAQNAILRAVEEADMEVIGVFLCEYMDVERLRSQIREADMIFAVGGGTVMDLCKVLAHEMEMPFFTFPTIASTCASCTSLGILRDEHGAVKDYSFSEIPPNHIFINTQIIADAPSVYLLSGMSGAIAKHYERILFSKGQTPRHSGAMGLALSPICAEPVMRWGVKAMLDCMAHQISEELMEVILACIVSAGYVSNFVQARDTVSLSHALYEGFRMFPKAEPYRYHHGVAVTYGMLVLLTIDQQYEERDQLYAFSKSIGLPAVLEDVHLSPEECFQVLRKAADAVHLPYELTDRMIMDGILEMEEYGKNTSDVLEEMEEECLISE